MSRRAVGGIGGSGAGRLTTCSLLDPEANLASAAAFFSPLEDILTNEAVAGQRRKRTGIAWSVRLSATKGFGIEETLTTTSARNVFSVRWTFWTVWTVWRARESWCRVLPFGEAAAWPAGPTRTGLPPGATTVQTVQMGQSP